jgi:histidine ammonia-lyase
MLELSDEFQINIQKCRDFLDKKMATHSEPIYGINTGFGSLCNVKISNEIYQSFRKTL